MVWFMVFNATFNNIQLYRGGQFYRCIGVAPKKKVVRPIFFVRRGLSPIFFLAYAQR